MAYRAASPSSSTRLRPRTTLSWLRSSALPICWRNCSAPPPRPPPPPTLPERELEIERRSLAHQPAAETRELATIYRLRGLDADRAQELAEAVMVDPDVALEVHAREELGVDPSDTGKPVGAALSSFVAFGVGALVPLIPWFFTEGTAAILASAIIGFLAAAAVGLILAGFTERSYFRTALRQVTWAVVACTATFAIGSWLGTVV